MSTDKENELSLMTKEQQQGIEAMSQLETLDWSRAVHVPAGSIDRNPVRIFQKPAYVEIDRNIAMFNPQASLESQRTPPVHYALYAFGVMDSEDSSKPSSIRTLRFPMVFRDRGSEIEERLFADLSKSTGKGVRELQKQASSRNIGYVISGNVVPNLHESLQMIFQTQPCVETGVQGEIQKYHRDADPTLFSGWTDAPDKANVPFNNSLVIVTEPSSGVYWYVDIGKGDETSDVAGRIISPSITAESLAQASPMEKEIISNLVKRNS
jgi:hypothetical protein